MRGELPRVAVRKYPTERGVHLVELGRYGKARDCDQLDAVIVGFRFEGQVSAFPREVSWSDLA